MSRPTKIPGKVVSARELKGMLHDGGELAEVEAVALEVVAQAPGRADDDMRALGELAGHFLAASTLPERLNCGRDMANLLFKDVPNPARID